MFTYVIKELSGTKMTKIMSYQYQVDDECEIINAGFQEEFKKLL